MYLNDTRPRAREIGAASGVEQPEPFHDTSHATEVRVPRPQTSIHGFSGYSDFDVSQRNRVSALSKLSGDVADPTPRASIDLGPGQATEQQPELRAVSWAGAGKNLRDNGPTDSDRLVCEEGIQRCRCATRTHPKKRDPHGRVGDDSHEWRSLDLSSADLSSMSIVPPSSRSRVAASLSR